MPKHSRYSPSPIQRVDRLVATATHWYDLLTPTPRAADEEALLVVEEQLHDQIMNALEEGEDGLLEAALLRLSQQERHDLQMALEDEIRSLSSAVLVDPDDDGPPVLRSLHLLPVSLNTARAVPAMTTDEVSGVTMAVTQVMVDTGLLAAQKEGAPSIRFLVDPQLWEMERVYGLTYSQAYRLNAMPKTLAYGVPNGVRSASGSIAVGLQFLAVWQERTLTDEDLDEDEVASTAPDGREDADEPAGEALAALRDALDAAIGDVFWVDVAADCWDAQVIGMTMHNKLFARLVLAEQLADTDEKPDHQFIVTLHAEGDAPQPDAPPEQMRAGLIGPDGALKAGICLTLNDWFDVDDGIDLVEDLADHYGSAKPPQVLDQTLPLEPEGVAASFLTPLGWQTLPHAV